MRWARMVLAVSLLVGWTSAAAAECAWVLWVREYTYESNAGYGTTGWDIEGGYEKQAQCLPERKTFMEVDIAGLKDAKHLIGVTRHKHMVAATFYFSAPPGGKMKSVERHFLCLPDTIDPREKK